MKKLLVVFFAIVGLTFAGCDDDDVLYMRWSVDNQSPDNITWSSENVNGIVYVSINVHGNGGDLIMTCENAKALDASFGYLGVYDNGWGVFSIEGTKLICHFPQVNSEKQSEIEQFTASAAVKGQVLNTSIRIVRTFGDTDHAAEKYYLHFESK